METKKENHTLQGFLNFSKILGTLKNVLSITPKPERKKIVVLVLFATIIAAIPYFQNGLLGKLIDAVIGYKTNGDIKQVLTILIFLIGTTALPNIIGLIRSFVMTRFRFDFIRHLNIYFLEKVGSLDIATIESTEYQELTQKANERGIGSIYGFIESSIDNFSNLIGVIISFVILSFIDKQLLLYAFLGSAPALYVQLRYGKNIYWIWDLNSNNRRKYFNKRSYFQGTIALTELKLYSLTKTFIGEIKKLLDSFDDELEGAEKDKTRWEFFALVVFAVCLGFGLWRIIHLALIGVLPIGRMVFAYTTYRGFKGTLAEFFRKIGSISESSNYTQYWFDINKLEPKIKNEPKMQMVDFENNPPTIEFKNVSFRYDANKPQYTLENLSFTITPGQKIAIVGLSGAGKTTLIKLLCRVYDPESGHILINGVDLKDINLASWQKQLGVLFQDFTSYQLTVREAIAVGNMEKNINNEEIVASAQMARAHDFIERLPKKYDQLLWKGFEDGVDLSKGERQRMALARVLYRKSPITILDEPTASVDALAEQEIFETLEQLPKDRTVILISHRFSTVKHADNIFVIEYGKLIEQGKHTTLMKLKGKYAELYKIQAESYK